MCLETDLDMVDVGGRVELTVANDARNDRHVATRSGLAISDLNFARLQALAPAAAIAFAYSRSPMSSLISSVAW